MSSLKNNKPEKFVTESVFKAEMKALREEIRTTVAEGINATLDAVRLMFEVQDQRNEKKFASKEKVDKMYDMMVDVVAEIQAMRQELAVGAHQTARLHDQVDSHETRIVVVEKHLNLG